MEANGFDTYRKLVCDFLLVNNQCKTLHLRHPPEGGDRQTVFYSGQKWHGRLFHTVTHKMHKFVASAFDR